LNSESGLVEADSLTQGKGAVELCFYEVIVLRARTSEALLGR